MIGQGLVIASKRMMNTVKDEKGSWGLGRVLTWVGAGMLTYAFYGESATRTLDWKDYVAYPVGMMIMYAPAKAIDIIKALGEAIRGGPSVPTSGTIS